KAFVQNEIQVLVSTTVIEVGVNVPNATTMVIYDAERFGLSQLHQLRGRVGRGEKQSYCILIAEPKGDIGKERMKIMTETSDGFELAEQDRKSTRLNSSHVSISYAVFCLKKKKKQIKYTHSMQDTER